MSVLKKCKAIAPSVYTKSSIMLGLGEHEDEIIETMNDLRSSGVAIVTIGQYLQPTYGHLPVVEYIRPETFDTLRDIGRSLGFAYVASGPLVRSSYRPGEFFLEKDLTHK